MAPRLRNDEQPDAGAVASAAQYALGGAVMTRPKQSGRRPATTKRPRDRQAPDAQQVQDLPNRDAMSILTGLPIIPGLPPGVLDSATAAPGSGDLTSQPAPDPGTVPVDGSTAGPINQVSSSNVESSGTTESTSATQEAPINQS